MRLLREIILVTFVLTVLLLVSVMAIQYTESKKYIQNELRETMINNLSAISSKLAQSQGDEVQIKSIIDLEFDNGYYESIKFVSSDENWTYLQKSQIPTSQSVPKWFVNITQAPATIVSSDVTSGWSVLGRVIVKASDDVFYKMLYDTFKKLMYIFLIFMTIALVAISLVMKIILNPLKSIEEQAKGIVNNQFIIQTKIPRTAEFKGVVVAMNGMVEKVKYIFENTNKELQDLKKNDYTDCATGLRNRVYLLEKLPQYLKVDAELQGGVNVMINLSAMTEANTLLGRLQIDKFYMRITEIFKIKTQNYDEVIVARLNGTDFDIFIPNGSLESVVATVEAIKLESIDTIREYGLNHQRVYLSFGVVQYNHTLSISEFFASTDQALLKAKVSPTHIYVQKFDHTQEAKGKDAWRAYITKALEQNAFSFVFNDVVLSKTNQSIHSMLVLHLVVDEKECKYVEFMPIAIALGLNTAIYTQAIRKLIKSMELSEMIGDYSLRLPAHYLNSQDAYEMIEQFCKEQSKYNESHFTIEVSDRCIRENFLFTSVFKALFQKYNISIGIFEFIGESANFDYIQEIKPSYIKIESNFLLAQEPYQLTTLKILAKTMNISLIATNTKDKESIQRLEAMDIDTVYNAPPNKAPIKNKF